MFQNKAYVNDADELLESDDDLDVASLLRVAGLVDGDAVPRTVKRDLLDRHELVVRMRRPVRDQEHVVRARNQQKDRRANAVDLKVDGIARVANLLHLGLALEASDARLAALHALRHAVEQRLQIVNVHVAIRTFV